MIADYDEDGLPDVFVANDNMPNFLFHNRRILRFVEMGLAAGVAVAADGKARAGMGIDVGDYDGDGRLDLVVTNLDFEMHTVYRGRRGLFADATVESGVGFPTLPFVGFGVVFLDYDNDARLDLAIVNGHVIDNALAFRAGATYAQRKPAAAAMRRGAASPMSARNGPRLRASTVGRGLAAGDIDNDGDLDLLATSNGGRPRCCATTGATGATRCSCGWSER